MVAPRSAWLVPPLGVGLYKDALPSSVASGMMLQFVTTKMKIQGAFNVPDHPFVKRDAKDELYFLIIDQDDNNTAHYLSGQALLELTAMQSAAAFSYSFDPVEESAPMRVSARERKDRPFDQGALYRAIQAVKTQASVKIIKPQ